MTTLPKIAVGKPKSDLRAWKIGELCSIRANPQYMNKTARVKEVKTDGKRAKIIVEVDGDIVAVSLQQLCEAKEIIEDDEEEDLEEVLAPASTPTPASTIFDDGKEASDSSGSAVSSDSSGPESG
jgi:hypothetical protein